MAAKQERISTATASEQGSDTVVVTCVVEGMQVKGLLTKSPKNAMVYVKFDDYGFDLTAELKNAVFRKVVKKLPGRIRKNDCTWKVEKDKVVIKLLKDGSEPWAVQLSQRGLEQQEDEEDDGDDQ